MRVVVRPLAFGRPVRTRDDSVAPPLPALRVMGRVHVELHRQPLRDEVLPSKALGQGHAVVMGQPRIGGQRQHDLPRHLGILSPFRPLGDIPEHGARRQIIPRPFGQQHRMVFRRRAMRERVSLARALITHRFPRIVAGRAHGAAAGGPGEIAGAGKGDGHADSLAAGYRPAQAAFDRMHIASASRSLPSLSQNPDGPVCHPKQANRAVLFVSPGYHRSRRGTRASGQRPVRTARQSWRFHTRRRNGC